MMEMKEKEEQPEREDKGKPNSFWERDERRREMRQRRTKREMMRGRLRSWKIECEAEVRMMRRKRWEIHTVFEDSSKIT